jgi:hypothetical protein
MADHPASAEDGRRGVPFRLTPAVGAASSVLAVDCNALDLRLRLRGLRQRHRQDAVLERGLNLVLLDLVPEGNLPLEAAIEALTELTLLVLGGANAKDSLGQSMTELPWGQWDWMQCANTQ